MSIEKNEETALYGLRAAKQMIRNFEEHIIGGKLAAGEKIPSLRKLAAEYKISYVSALRGINFLCTKGLLQKSANRGFFVSAENKVHNVSLIKVAVVMPPHCIEKDFGGLINSAYTGIHTAADKKVISLVSLPVKEDAFFSGNEWETLIQGCKGAVFLGNYDELLQKIQFRIPAVAVLSMSTGNGSISCIGIDAVSGAESAWKYFKDKNCSNIHIFSNPGKEYRLRALTCRFFWEEKENKLPPVSYFGNDSKHDFNFQYGTGYFFSSDHLLQIFSLNWQKKHNKILSEEFCVLGFDGKRVNQPDFHNFPTIACDWREIGTIALEECIDRINNPGRPARRIGLTGRLIQ